MKRLIRHVAGAVTGVVREFVKDNATREQFAVAVVAQDGSLFLFDRRFFEEANPPVLLRRRWRENHEGAAERIMSYVYPYFSRKDFELVQPLSVGQVRTYFLVWFAPIDFDPSEPAWGGSLHPVQDPDYFKPNQVRAVNYIVDRAKELHEQRLTESFEAVVAA